MSSLKFFSLISLLAITACSAKDSATKITPSSLTTAWLTNGSVVVAGPIPSKSTPSTDVMLGFMPNHLTTGNAWLSINTKEKKISLMKGNLFMQSLSMLDIDQNLTSGNYKIALKQKNALWHAKDEYFEKRKMPIPAEGSTSRFLRGALGNSVIYLNEALAIHDSKLALSEVGGIRLSKEDMDLLYKNLEVGAQIEIQ